MQQEMNVCPMEFADHQFENNSALPAIYRETIVAPFYSGLLPDSFGLDGLLEKRCKKSGFKNKDKLWSYFYSIENYPEYYLGVAKRVAICMDPNSGKEKWYNADRCLSVENPTKGAVIKVSIQIKNTIYTEDLIFVDWARIPIHEWRMKSGTILQLDQVFVDSLPKEDKRFLRMCI